MIKKLKSMWSLNIAAICGWIAMIMFVPMVLRQFYFLHFTEIRSASVDVIILGIFLILFLRYSYIPIVIAVLCDFAGLKIKNTTIFENRNYHYFFVIGIAAYMMLLAYWVRPEDFGIHTPWHKPEQGFHAVAIPQAPEAVNEDGIEPAN